MRRISIRALMVAVVVLAVALTALRNANDYWAGGMLLGTALLIGISTIVAIYQSGARRAARLGFTVFAGGYFALVFLGLSEQKLALLPTHTALIYVHNHVAPPIHITGILNGSITSVGSSTTWIYPQNGTSSTASYPSVNIVQNPAPRIRLGDTIQAVSPSNTTSPNWSAMLPGVANFEAFTTIAHCLYTLMAGLLGAAIALRCEGRRSES